MYACSRNCYIINNYINSHDLCGWGLAHSITISFLIQDKLKALELFLKGADRGSAEAQYYLGKMYYGKAL